MSHPMLPFESQNVQDDDAQVLDSLFEQNSNAPDITDIQEPILVRALREPAVVTRLFSGDVTISPDWASYQLFPADENRRTIVLSVYSVTPTNTDGVRFSDDPGMIRQGGKVLHNGSIELRHHTGPLWVFPCGNAANGAASAAVQLQYWSVTV